MRTNEARKYEIRKLALTMAIDHANHSAEYIANTLVVGNAKSFEEYLNGDGEDDGAPAEPGPRTPSGGIYAGTRTGSTGGMTTSVQPVTVHLPGMIKAEDVAAIVRKTLRDLGESAS